MKEFKKEFTSAIPYFNQLLFESQNNIQRYIKEKALIFKLNIVVCSKGL